MSATVIVGLQFGDEGKGKIVDAFAADFRFIIRFNGGANAGHTVENARGTFKLHLVPSGIFHPSTRCLLGNGVVVDPAMLARELETLRTLGIDVSRVQASSRAHMVMPWHKTADDLAERSRGGSAIGTTRRGIGPCYSDKVGRRGLRLGDLLDPTLPDRIAVLREERFDEFDRLFPGESFFLTVAGDLRKDVVEWQSALGGIIADTDEIVGEAWRAGEPILLEGAQATMLDIERGTYPYVSSSCATAAGACTGSGLPPTAISKVVGVAKAYTTRVGAGSFPSELHDGIGERLRIAGNEFGTTTGRPRRCGWFDAAMVRYAARANGATELVLTKLDVLTSFTPLRIATGYRYRGVTRLYPWGPPDRYEEYVPEYVECNGWTESIAGATSWKTLPAAARRYVENIEMLVGVPITMVTTGPHRDAVIRR